MTDLTEQLENGSYYIKDTNGNIYIDDYYKEIGEFTFAGTRLKEVLAPVPSYEKYLSLTYAKEEDEGIISEYEAENTKLKELLKECKHIVGIEKDFASCHFEKDKLGELLNKIDEVLK